jgi:hypothetical protein
MLCTDWARVDRNSAKEFCGWARAAMRFGAMRKSQRLGAGGQGNSECGVASGRAIPCTLSAWLGGCGQAIPSGQGVVYVPVQSYSFRACMHASYALSVSCAMQERVYRTVLQCTRSMLDAKSVVQSYSCTAVATHCARAVYRCIVLGPGS